MLVPCRPIRFSDANYRYQSEATYRPYARGGNRAYPAALCLPSCAVHHVEP